MSNTLRIKRSTSTSAPTTLQNAEIAYSELSDKFFIGVGTGGAGGSATSIVAIGGKGAFTDLTSDQTVAGVKTFSSSPVVPTVTSSDSSTKAASTAFVKAQGYLVSGDLSGYLTASNAAATYQTLSGMSAYLTTESASGTYAPISSPTFTGTPAAPTATAGTNTTQVATTAFVSTAVSNLVAGAGAALDTLNELATALGNDANFATTISTSLGEKLVKSNNLSDLTSAATARTNLGLGTMAVEAAADYLSKAGNLSGLASTSTARTNLGLGTMATQAASNVAITGGSIDGVTIDGGTF